MLHRWRLLRERRLCPDARRAQEWLAARLRTSVGKEGAVCPVGRNPPRAAATLPPVAPDGESTENCG
eukprot:936504-Lingulodinium_polyedra.AAC.1